MKFKWRYWVCVCEDCDRFGITMWHDSTHCTSFGDGEWEERK
jgi:hypothetical protein